MSSDQEALSLERANISLIGQSEAAGSLRRMVDLAAASDAPLLITNGDDESVADIAMAVHVRSIRTASNLVHIDCEADGAHIDDPILTEKSIGGTLLLSKIDALPSAMYHAMHTLVQNRDIRTISATRHFSRQLNEDRNFPLFLSSALSVLTLPVPALSARRFDIPLLYEAVLFRMPQNMRFTLDNGASRLLIGHKWENGLSELKDVMTQLSQRYAGRRVTAKEVHQILGTSQSRAAIGAKNAKKRQIDEQLLVPGFSLNDYLAEKEAMLLRAALKKSHGVVKHAAEYAGLKRTTFLAKMKKHGITKAQ